MEYLRTLNAINKPQDKAYFSWVTNNKTVYADLIKCTTFEASIFLKFSKANCDVFRYETNTSKAGKITPIIAIDVNRKLVYFWENPELDDSGFETKGIKIQIWPENWEPERYETLVPLKQGDK